MSGLRLAEKNGCGLDLVLQNLGTRSVLGLMDGVNFRVFRIICRLSNLGVLEIFDKVTKLQQFKVKVQSTKVDQLLNYSSPYY